MPRLAVRGLQLAYEEVGTGTPIVFISGTSVDRTIWGGQVAALMGKYRCVSFDNRDVGESTMVTAPYTPADMARDTAGLMEALGLPPSHVVGHSLGGAVAQELALAAADRVRSLTLVGTWARNDEYTRALFHTWKRMRTQLGPREFLEAMLLTGVGHVFLNAVGAQTLIDMFAADPHPQPPDAYCRQVDADLAHDTSARLASITAPTLVVGGEDDFIFPRHHHRMLVEGIRGAELLMLPAVGHTPLIENAERFNEVLAAFLARH